MESIMSIFESIARFTSNYRARRRRYNNYMKLSSLPMEIQKDIGWMEAFDETDQDVRPRRSR